MLFLLLVFSFLFLSIFFFVCVIITLKKIERLEQVEKEYALVLKNASVSHEQENDQNQLAEQLLLEILPAKIAAKWAKLFAEKKCGDPHGNGSGHEEEVHKSSGAAGSGMDDSKRVKKKKRSKKKKLDSKGEEESIGEEKEGEEKDNRNSNSGNLKPKLICLYPFTTSGSATQRKIKQQYSNLVQCHENKKLTLAQVVEFAHCLIEAKDDLEHKSEAINRKFTITKALLNKADRSSIDRICQQLFKLEKEQKILENDAFVYNWLQRQLKLSPAYKKMLEVHASMEKAKSSESAESTDTEEAIDISFEELLAQEKKDSFWQKNGRLRLSPG